MTQTTRLISILTLFVLTLTGCGKDTNPIAPFEPEVINNADAFQFQITAAENVTTTVNYQWDNTGTQGTVDHSTARTAGSATVTIFDDTGAQVYSSALLASGNEATISGQAGTWTVRVVFSEFDGAANFRVEKL